jgi:hypothetical protein
MRCFKFRYFINDMGQGLPENYLYHLNKDTGGTDCVAPGVLRNNKF